MNQSFSNPFGDDQKPQLVLVQDHLQECPYLDQTARMPLEFSVSSLGPDDTDDLLASGYRRSGEFLYRTQCPACNECKPTRVLVDRFEMTRSMRRVFKRGEKSLTCRWSVPSADQQRVEMFNAHRESRDLGSGETVARRGYESFLAETCFETLELAVFLGEKLVAISIVDVGRTSLSAVYTHFLPDYSRFSLGTYAVLKQIEWAAQTDRKHVYLGMYVAANHHLNYKARFTPQERLIEGKWVLIDSPQT